MRRRPQPLRTIRVTLRHHRKVLRRVNDRWPWLLLTDAPGWHDAPRDRILNVLRARRAERLGPYSLDPLFAQRRPRAPHAPDGPLEIVLFMRHWGYVKNFEAVIRELGRRGHGVRLLLEPTKKGEDSPSGLVQRLVDEVPTVSARHVTLRGAGPWVALGRQLRFSRDLLRYYEPDLQMADKLRARARKPAPAWAVRLADGPLAARPWLRRRVDQLFESLLSLVPPGSDVRELLEAERPDVLVVTPMVDGSRQPELVRAARELDLPTCLCVASWDNLSTKGLIHEAPDAVCVWNEQQGVEATRLHGVPADRVVVTGAHTYDHWFAWEQTQKRAAFCAQVGLPADRPFVLYLCSSSFIAGSELEAVADWVGWLREAPDPRVAGSGVLIRPHPMNAAGWREAAGERRFGDLAVVWPTEGVDPDAPSSRADYYDSIHHAEAVVGINTSALIESAIVDRPVLTVLRPEFVQAQERSIHFSYLRTVGGGLLLEARTPAEHIEQLRLILDGQDPSAGQRRAFVRSFLRPRGVDRAAAPLLADAVERVAGVAVPRARTGPAVEAARIGLLPLARLAVVEERRQRAKRRQAKWAS